MAALNSLQRALWQYKDEINKILKENDRACVSGPDKVWDTGGLSRSHVQDCPKEKCLYRSCMFHGMRGATFKVLEAMHYHAWITHANLEWNNFIGLIMF